MIYTRDSVNHLVIACLALRNKAEHILHAVLLAPDSQFIVRDGKVGALRFHVKINIQWDKG